MRFESRTGMAALRLAQAAEQETLSRIRQELDDIRRLMVLRREMKYSPDQPRDWHGRWTDGGGGEAASDNPPEFGVAPDGTLVESIAECTGISAHALQRMQERGITPDAITDTLTNPTRVIQQANGNTLYIGPRARVVLNPNGWMVTCY